LIWDEVITGYRTSLAGAAPYFDGVIPDLRALGKALGGGFPVGAYGGRKEVMDKVVRRELGMEKSAWQSGTFSGNIVTMVAGLATITYLEEENPYSHLNNMGERIRSGWKKIADSLGIKVDIAGIASQSRLAFLDKPVRNLRDYSQRDKAKEAAHTMGLLVNGIFALNPNHIFVSAAHSDKDIDKFLEASERVIKDIETLG
jgi:glutamate-1-semialdehyde 2,1-aminomutase